MYRNYISGRNPTARSNNNTNLNPPWATAYTAPDQPTSRGSGGGRGSRNGGRNSRDGATPGRTSGSANGNGNSAARSRDRRLLRTYGRRLLSLSPYYRDLPYLRGIFPHRMPSRGTTSSRESERGMREENTREERRNANEERAGREVEPEVPQKKNVLTVIDCHLHLETNTKAHHTQLYECTDRDVNPQLVIRRGQPFQLTFIFQRPWDIEHDDMSVQLEIGENPQESEGTLFEINLDETEANEARSYEGWDARLLEQKGNQVTVAIFIAADAIVGEWKCGVTTSVKGSDEQFFYDGVGEIFVIFNPWCREDQVFFTDDPGLLDEYIMNEYGCVFEGNSDFISRRPWIYGQFRDGILDTCMTILRLAFESPINKDMSDVITVTRKLSRVLNDSNRDPGIMTGNWSRNYSAGKAPSSWRGSLNILKRFARTERPVKFAQCFVFSHVFTTVLRALGIPSRSLTNFESAHDTDKTVTIDSYVDENGNDLDHLKSDSIWNYHCWNDIWINRPDLDHTSSSRDRYSGWHAVDSTPQERSEGRFQCGPCPLTAIKNGELSVGFDTNFIYGEVNGEVCTWSVPFDSSKEMKLIERKPNAVGKRISTKLPDGKPARGTFNPGSREVHEQRIDITSLYKYPENSEEERNSLKMAIGDGFHSRIFQNSAGVDLEIGQVHNLVLGSNFEFKVILSNQSSESKLVDLNLGVYPMDYRGERLGWNRIAHQKFEGITLRPTAREVFSLKVMEKIYVEQCDNSMSMMLRAFAKVSGEEKPLSKLKKIVMVVPPLSVKNVTPTNRISRQQPFTVNILVTNPCSKPMTSCSLQLSGTIDPMPSQDFVEEDGTYIRRIKDIFPNEIRNINIEVKAQKRPLKSGIRELDVDVLSDELPELSGSMDIELV